MRMRMFAVLTGALFVCHGAALAQERTMPTLGILALGNPDPSVFIRDFKAGLGGLGYVEGKNIRLEFRSAEGQSSRLAPLAQDLVAMKVAALVTYQTPAALAAKAATSEIPIVMAGAADPVGSGLIQSLSHPGGNVTGVTGATSQLGAKNLELIKEVVPSARRVAVLANEPDPFHKILIANAKAAAAQLGLQLDVVLAKVGDDFDRHFETMKSAGVDGVLVQPSLPLGEVAASAAKSGLPAACPHLGFTQAGGLMAYAADQGVVHEQTATMVDKVLKGRKPADLPVEITTRFRVAINAKAANAIGVKLSPLLLTRADEVIE
ncbi:ABC transporter substrate-binding protein [Bradyrhizobium lablabi]|uniref:ABC transporter substrate-binding protein n=1 Tax=Bradyrhizobium lablabi TaxID=722472 RepID=UPI001BA84A8C|nr:ABC transporter substrate-binding protein [Bradyrhizobium lablabi]MBR1126071.1 ABC transporter substrate-binding protein [Bradyrhizobium lablabi]